MGRRMARAQRTGARPRRPKKAAQVLFIAGFGPIVPEGALSRQLYADALGIGFEEMPGGYMHTERLSGAKHFALWPLAQAAESCFGTDRWPETVPVPQAWLEFDVDDLPAATRTLESRGYRLLVRARREPWGQTVTRFLSPEGLLVGVTVSPWLRDPP
jgi:hypothetical protein